MTYIELEKRIQKLEELIKEVAAVGRSPEWNEKAQKALAAPEAPKTLFCGKKWEGEQCATCKHSSVFHANGGICTKVNCECCKFESSGVAVEF